MIRARLRRRRRGAPTPVTAGVLAAVLLSGVVTGCSGGSSSAGSSSSSLSGPSSGSASTTPTTTSPTKPTAPGPAKAPATDTCRKLDYAAISHYSNADPTVPCRKQHTAYTFATPTIPAAVSVPGVSIGNRSIQDAAAARCRNAFATFIGGSPATRSLSRLSVTYFLPEQRDFNHGAHWVRCDVIALKTFNQLAPLPQKLAGLLDRPAALKTYGVCSTGDPGTAASRLVMCSGTHAYRALAALRLGGEHSPYPGRQVAGTDGQKRCSTFIADKLGTTGGYTFGWTYPTPSDWASGQRFGYCWLKSST